MKKGSNIVILCACLLVPGFATLDSPPAMARSPVLTGRLTFLHFEGDANSRALYNEGDVYTAGPMVMRVFRKVRFLFFSGRIKSRIADYRTSELRLKDRILSFWTGKKPEKPCRVTCVPMKEKGYFEFHDDDPSGPQGYLQCIGRDEDGYMRYRVWFRQKDEPRI